MDPPKDLATSLVDLLELGRLVAMDHSLPRGIYEVVVEYKFGASLLTEGERKFSAMAITFGGIALRPVKEANSMTIEIGSKKKAKALSP